ncbi:MFS transporter [Streptomyces sp. NPDC002795]|uniref:MFS transporter n=1 Tax=Streptomyces sp. NPDC002795 TaxID=3364665 RepID=UPI00367F70CD
MALNLNPSHGAVPKRHVFTVLVLIILFSEIATFELIMVYPALPDMAEELGTLHIAWTASILTLAGATVQPLVGKAADKWGKKNVVVWLGVVFILGSVVCALATSFPMMLVGRSLQGCLVGIVTLSYSLVRDIMPRDFVPIALGTVVTGIGMSALFGPFLAGWLIDSFGYHGVFWFLALYVAVLMPVYAALVPESDIRVDRPIDYLGTVLMGPGIAVLLLGVTQGTEWGWTSGLTLACLIAGVAMLAAFVWWERVCRHPLIDMRVLFGRKFGATILAVVCVSYMMNANALIGPTLFRTPDNVPGISYGAGLTALEYALWTCPLGIAAMVVGPLGGYLSKKAGARNVLIAAALLFLAGMYFGSQMFTVQWQVGLMALTIGCGNGFLHSSNANLLQDALPASQSGVGNSIGGMSTLLTAAIATAVTGTVMSQHVLRVDPKTHSVLYADSALTNAYGWAAAVGAVGLLIALFMKHGRAPAQGGLAEQEDVRLVDDVDAAAPKPVG